MPNVINIYARGADPFVLPWGDDVLVIHQGSPVDRTPAPTPPAQDTDTDTDVFVPTKLGGTYQNYIIAPGSADAVSSVLHAQTTPSIDLGLVLGEGTGARMPPAGGGEQLKALLDAIGEFTDGDVTVHVIRLDEDAADSDG